MEHFRLLWNHKCTMYSRSTSSLILDRCWSIRELIFLLIVSSTVLLSYNSSRTENIYSESLQLRTSADFQQLKSLKCTLIFTLGTHNWLYPYLKRWQIKIHFDEHDTIGFKNLPPWCKKYIQYIIKYGRDPKRFLKLKWINFL